MQCKVGKRDNSGRPGETILYYFGIEGRKGLALSALNYGRKIYFGKWKNLLIKVTGQIRTLHSTCLAGNHSFINFSNARD